MTPRRRPFRRRQGCARWVANKCSTAGHSADAIIYHASRLRTRRLRGRDAANCSVCHGPSARARLAQYHSWKTMSDKLQDVFRVKESGRANYLRAPAPPFDLSPTSAYTAHRRRRLCSDPQLPISIVQTAIRLHLPISIFAQGHHYDTTILRALSASSLAPASAVEQLSVGTTWRSSSVSLACWATVGYCICEDPRRHRFPSEQHYLLQAASTSEMRSS